MPACRKHERSRKSQLGQFFTPDAVVSRVLSGVTFQPDDVVLEPGCGDGAFVVEILRRLCGVHGDVVRALERNLYAVEKDPEIHAALLRRVADEFGVDLTAVRHHLICGDFLLHDFGDLRFTHVVGNPPFGGTIEAEHQDRLDREFGRRGGFKIKKETYGFFLVKSFELLRPTGRLSFVCSDTFLTISTMKGLRRWLMDSARVSVTRLTRFSGETSYPMVVIVAVKGGDGLSVDGKPVRREWVDGTGNASWAIDSEGASYFGGHTLGEFLVCTGGMTIGNNGLFLRTIENGCVTEPYEFEFFEQPITVDGERSRAKLNRLTASKLLQAREAERGGRTRRNVRAVPRAEPLVVELPHGDYRYYNKATGALVYSPPGTAIYWRDDGDAVYTFKRNGNWYLHGVGGKRHFGREGITWSLVASRLKARYLPPGYILDSGAPCGFLREGVPRDELFFILGWCLTDRVTWLLKTYINHTPNIQGKDVERLPYPGWVNSGDRRVVIAAVKRLVADVRSGREVVVGGLDGFFEPHGRGHSGQAGLRLRGGGGGKVGPRRPLVCRTQGQGA